MPTPNCPSFIVSVEEIGALDINNPKLDAFIKKHETNADNDLILATALKNSSAAIVLGYFFHMSQDELDYRIEPSQIDRQIERISASKYPLVIYKDKDIQIDPFFKAYAPESNLEIFSQSAASSGYYSVRSDQDGVVRWMPLIIQCGEDLFPPLSVLCVWHYLDEPQLMVKVARYGVEGIQLGERFIPTDENGELLINYLGPPKTFRAHFHNRYSQGTDCQRHFQRQDRPGRGNRHGDPRPAEHACQPALSRH